MYISKKVINELNNLNKIIDDLIIDKKFLDTINTPMSTVINFKAVNYNVGMVTISLDKVNKTINIISSNCNKTIVLGNHISASEVKYIEDELLKRIPKGK
jgi:membrane-bound inhibitor of C-type lysozyme